MTKDQQPAVQLWIGSHKAVVAAVIQMLQHTLSTSCAGCGLCSACERIAQRQSAYVFWHQPQPNGYTREQIEEAMSPLKFALDEDQVSFLILEAAEQLLPGSGNALLKILEEPPRHWYILLLSERPNMILPTVRSRCVERIVAAKDAHEASGVLLAWLSAPSLGQWQGVVGSLELVRKAPLEVAPILDTLIVVWHAKLQAGPAEQLFAQQMLLILQAAYSGMPGPQGNVSFWRSLVLSVRRLL